MTAPTPQHSLLVYYYVVLPVECILLTIMRLQGVVGSFVPYTRYSSDMDLNLESVLPPQASNRV